MQRLSRQARADKKIRDLMYANKRYREIRRNENQKHLEGQKPDSDLHHKSDGSIERVSTKNNRGNFGKGTKNE